MNKSAEIRWFCEGNLPSKIESWFHSIGNYPPGGGQVREDEYLLDVAQVEIGIKKRGGSYDTEIKGLVTIHKDSIRVGPLVGHIQVWNKWTVSNLPIGASTISVQKRRWLRKFDARDGSLREIELDAREGPSIIGQELPQEGCNVEITSVCLGHATNWWTLGCEAFGRDEPVEAILRKTLEYLASTKIPRIRGGIELSYPAWLQRVASSRL